MSEKPVIIKPKQTISESIKMVLYGDSGVGKTTFAATATKSIYLSAEAGLLSIRDKDIDVVTINKWPDLHNAFEWLKNNKHDYRSVIVDSLTEIQKKHQDHILAANGKEEMTQQLWGHNIEAMRKACRAFRDLPLNVILITLASEIASEDGGAPLKRPSLQGKSLPNEIMGFVDLVGYMVAKERKNEKGQITISRAIRFQPNESISAKDRSGKLDTWEQPDFNSIYQKIFPQKTTPVATTTTTIKNPPKTATKEVS